KNENKNESRPITFIYNGGPGSASLWLHMGALGPKRVIATQPEKTQLAPYQLTDNQYSLLNVSDLVFIDAPGTGYSRFSSSAASQPERAQQKAQSASNVYGVNGDAQAFSQFIVQFLTHYQRWNSPKYLLGESYGTTRSVVLAETLKNQNIDLNGIILMSQFLNYDNNVDDPNQNPGVDQPYYLALPTYAASAWYHQRLPGKHQSQTTLLDQAEQFALGT
ncbi:S10 family serine carboxypeptidase-like protein, partial [Serratia ureilytica]|uniref:S10 family serine carboxypeptidase-like protein n=1 Tax=Serratia ureilytica TaxID=300181 RepID=UPI003F6CE922